MIRTLPKAFRRGWMRIVPAALLAVFALSAAPAEARAQEETWLAEVGAYRLSDEGLERFRQAIHNLVEVIEADPSIHHRGAATDGFEETIAFLEQEPAVGRALAAAGMPAREYVLFSMAFIQAGVVMHMADAMGESSLDELPESVSRENVAYFRANRERLEGVTEEVQTMMRRMEHAAAEHAGHAAPADPDHNH
jgi:hypothetical protein